MKLRELFKTTHKATAAFCFGRFNPPHQGHAAVWEAVKHAGHKWYIGTNPTTIGPNDPLGFELKSAWMTAIDPSIKGHILPETSVVTLAAEIYKHVGEGATIAYVTDDNDWNWAGKLLMDYNGKESNHGYYKFAKIIHVPSPRVSSATALRAAARANDKQAFYQASGTNPKLAVQGKTYFDTVVAAVGEHPEKVKRAKKEIKNHVVSEAKPTGKMPKTLADAGHGGETIMRDQGGYDRTYHLNRIMMAAAMADGRSKKPVKMDPDSWVEKYNVAFPYTDEEQMMMFQAMATIPTDGKELQKRSKSQEASDTNITSAVAKPKRNKYGI